MGFENFPQPEPENLEKAKEATEVAIGYLKIWNQLAEGQELPVPTDDPEQAKVYIEKMEELKKIFDARYSPEEKETVFPHVDAYIEKLKGLK